MLAVHVPDRINDRRRCEMDHTFFRAGPPQLTITRDKLPRGAHVSKQPFDLSPDQKICNGRNCGTANLIASANCEGHAVAIGPAIDMQHHIRR